LLAGGEQPLNRHAGRQDEGATELRDGVGHVLAEKTEAAACLHQPLHLVRCHLPRPFGRGEMVRDRDRHGPMLDICHASPTWLWAPPQLLEGPRFATESTPWARAFQEGH